MANTPMNNSDLIVAILKMAGVRHGFGVPSGPVLALMEAMRTGGVDFVLTAHEGTAGFAADVSGRITKAPGVGISTLGPGATNLATGVGSAWLDRSPMLAITCTLPSDQIGRRIQMYIDHHALFRPITKATFSLKNGSIVPTMLEAIRIAMSEPRGPVHLDLPDDIAKAPATEELPAALLDPEPVPAAHSAALQKASELLRESTRPVAVIGMSAMRMRDPRLLREFIERWNIPFATTTMTKGLIDDDHPLAAGCIERSCRQLQRKFLRQADLVVGIGYDTVEVEYEAWIGDVPLMQIDIEAADRDASVNQIHEVIGDLDTSLTALLRDTPDQRRNTGLDVAAHRREFQQALRQSFDGMSPSQAIDAAREVLPHDGILAFDVGAHTHQIASQWSAHTPGTFLITNGWSSMGFGIPAAIAAKLANPDRPVACMLGDGCFQMTCGEVIVARRHRLAIPFIVLDDGWLSLIQVKQLRRDLEYYGVELDSLDRPATPSNYFGVPAIAVNEPGALREAVSKALAASGPTIIEARINPKQYELTVVD